MLVTFIFERYKFCSCVKVHRILEKDLSLFSTISVQRNIKHVENNIDYCLVETFSNN